MAKMFFCLVTTIFFLTACGPPGPRALLKGEQLIQQGQYEKAIQKLQQATLLLPRNPQAWNYLGLAYHANRQPVLAIRAYKQALALDSSLAAARFNLGCVYLDHNELTPAIEQLTSYTYVQPNSAEAWLKLGTAQYRTNRYDSAEKSFRMALDLQPNNIEALNGLGLLQFQKRRYPEALNSFNLAIAQNPKYAPALLNAAITSQRTTGKAAALQFYRRYLALNPPDAATIAPLANQLDAELNPAPPPAPPRLAVEPTNVPSVLKTQSVAKMNVGSNAPLRTNQLALQSSNATPALTHPASSAFALSNLPTAPNTIVAATPADPALEVTRVDGGLVIVPPQDLGADGGIAPAGPASPVTDTNSSVIVREASKTSKDSFLTHLNPFTRKPKPTNGTQVAAITEPKPTVVVFNNTAPAEPAGPSPVVEKPVLVPRYAYQFPARPVAGNKLEAQQYLSEANRAHQRGMTAEAIGKYKKAAAADPSLFEAHYNLALACYTAASWNEALSACERALSIRPDSVDARFWFGLALREAKYPQDAADQLLIILQNHPDDYRVHLSLANLYARQLKQPQLAREHYLKVLELSPRHSEAANIRLWLAANPPTP